MSAAAVVAEGAAILAPAAALALAAYGAARLLLAFREGALELLRAVEARDAQDAQVRVVDCRPWGLDRTFHIAEATSGAAECGGGAGEFGGFGHGGGPSSLVAGLQAPRCESPPFGLSIWSASFGLARHLLENREELARAALGAGRAVLELGCGQPLLAMVLLEAFPRLGRVVATDGHEGVLRLARQNLAENVPSPRPEAVLAQLRWGDAGDMARAEEINEGRKYDVILGADVTYDHDEMGHALVQTIVGLAHRGTVVWLAHELRADDRIGAAWATFADELRSAFASVEAHTRRLPGSEAPMGDRAGSPCEVEVWRCTGLLAAGAGRAAARA